MSYQVLARKWRPRSFQQMLGQEHVLGALINALDSNRLHHAYLFTGTRGVGKTTIARILAKCLNCEQGVSSTPCGVCSTCLDIDQGRFIDLMEVDAASRTKVEDTRALLDNVPYAPTRGRYKIYLIDEVHMLSGHSFNALLKTLEEPPEHVKFLLATTDPKRLPITVLSRCLQFHLKNMTPEQIQSHLQYVLGEEKIPYESAALRILSQSADGSVRDALSLLDQAISHGGGKVTLEDVSAMLGAIDPAHVWALLEALAQKDANALIAQHRVLYTQGADFSQVLEDMLSLLHHVALVQVVPDVISDLPFDQDRLQNLAKLFSPEDVQLCYQIGLIGRRDLSLAPSLQTGFEMILLRMLAFRPVKQSPVILSEPSVVESGTVGWIKERSDVSAEALAKVGVSTNGATTTEATVDTRRAGQVHAPTSEPTEQTTFDWVSILPKLNLTGLTHTLATHCAFVSYESNHVQLSTTANYAALLQPKHIDRIAQALSAHLQQAITVKITNGDAMDTPAVIQQQRQDAKHQQAMQTLQSDPQVQMLIETFDATILPQHIKHITEDF